MTPLKLTVTILCILSVVSGLSVAVVSGWAISIKYQSFDELYPKGEEVGKNATLGTHKIWEHLKMSWASSQVRDASLIGLCLATGVIQTLIALIILYGWEKASERILASRFILCNIITFLVLLGCVIVTSSVDHLSILKIPLPLRQAFDLSDDNQFIAFLAFGINSFTVWVVFDLVYLLVNNVIICCFLRRSSTTDLIIVAV
ncbi:uncharacterized protein LOC110852951 [Folsomia candida]|uniref:Chloride channel protein B n=1 Tax=Folsomia candida TaxID=158441 RepID=A0A226E077_FOLCA|nr:uncharacterized protein LOC110852951 [Folsomia candida]OXA50869.1 Chloride channel protein B [Folsomia candida]